jgi:hypothetical protein
MDTTYTKKEQEGVARARESFSGRLLTNAQFDEAMAITGIVEREIQRSGTFKEKLGDYAYAFARTERFDAMKAESIIRDLFKERAGQTMNEMREGLLEREQKLTDVQRQKAYEAACDIGDMMEKGDKLTSHRACSMQAEGLARDFDITDAGARRTMADEFNAAEGMELNEWGKELDEKFYRPQIEAEKAEREKQSQTRTRTRSASSAATSEGARPRATHRSRTGPS